MKIPAERVKQLREKTGAGIMECRNALLETKENMEQALEFLKQRGAVKAEQKKKRVASEGLIEAYIHAGGHIGAMVEVNCETDFTARTNEFKELVHNLAMQVVAMSPQFVSPEEAHEETNIEAQTACLLLQPYIKNLNITVQDIISETIAKVGENIKVSRFARFELGEQ